MRAPERVAARNAGLSCSSDDGVSDLQEKVLGMLEGAGIPQEVCDRMIEILWCYETASAIETEGGDVKQAPSRSDESATRQGDAQ